MGSYVCNTYDRATCGRLTMLETTAKAEFNFANSNQVTLGCISICTLYLGASKDTEGTEVYATGTDGVTVYKLANCSVGSASIDFDIEGIAQIAMVWKRSNN